MILELNFLANIFHEVCFFARMSFIFSLNNQNKDLLELLFKKQEDLKLELIKYSIRNL